MYLDSAKASDADMHESKNISVMKATTNLALRATNVTSDATNVTSDEPTSVTSNDYPSTTAVDIWSSGARVGVEGWVVGALVVGLWGVV